MPEAAKRTSRQSQEDPAINEGFITINDKDRSAYAQRGYVLHEDLDGPMCLVKLAPKPVIAKVVEATKATLDTAVDTLKSIRPAVKPVAKPKPKPTGAKS